MDNSDRLSSGTDNGEGKFCPLINDPKPDCYCFNLNSQTIALAVKYCQGDYLGCAIYLREKKNTGF